ncbi:hypothetical protein F511_14782 [Dorcoceras hygrometricum]|uniref:Uncharacterized protein n=1 Tax=Dorcoceras hygrometricum TaxID=472368 RepID=A0A2Z7BQE3_9LAMI|nr:hypothetical protein F511_14782 [Dorcoceras hygrometricum]
MPPRRGRGRAVRQVVDQPRVFDSEEDVVEPRVPLRSRARQAESEVEHLTRRMDSMELILAMFQRMILRPSMVLMLWTERQTSRKVSWVCIFGFSRQVDEVSHPVPEGMYSF